MSTFGICCEHSDGSQGSRVVISRLQAGAMGSTLGEAERFSERIREPQHSIEPN